MTKPQDIVPQNTGGKTICLTVGTAGHIDHGKTSLTKLLTGCDTDRLPEEKARGMTIDLGFATCTLPNDRRVGIVDVPGHERFIHNMVAGVTGIDVVMLVVAADDGVMPQTIEHFHIVRLLGIKSGLIALNKIDLAGPERIEEVKEQIKTLVKGSFLEGAPILPISTKTAEGFDHFYDVFVATVDRAVERSSSGPFRLHVERSFALHGLGTIISGIPCSGLVKAGDMLELLPAGITKKVRQLQVYGVKAEEGRAGECVALNMPDLAHEEVKRGMVLASPGYFKSARFINARFYLLPHLERPIQPRTAIRMHIGTSDIPGHLVLPTTTPMRPGEESFVQIQLQHPAVAAPGDSFILRQLSPVITLGGGVLIAPDDMRLRRVRKDNWASECAEKEKALHDSPTAILKALEESGYRPATIDTLARITFLTPAAVSEQLTRLLAGKAVIELDRGRYIHAGTLESAKSGFLKVLNGMHDRAPLCLGFPSRDIFKEFAVDHAVVEKAVAVLSAAGEISINTQGYYITTRAPSLSPGQSALAARIVETYKKTGFASPRRDEIPAAIGAPENVVAPIFNFLIQSGTLAELSDKVVLHKDWLEESRQKLVEYISKNGSIETGVFKDVLGTTRKYSIPVLEYWDAKGLTKRTGNMRVLKAEQKAQRATTDHAKRVTSEHR